MLPAYKRRKEVPHTVSTEFFRGGFQSWTRHQIHDVKQQGNKSHTNMLLMIIVSGVWDVARVVRDLVLLSHWLLRTTLCCFTLWIWCLMKVHDWILVSVINSMQGFLPLFHMLTTVLCFGSLSCTLALTYCMFYIFLPCNSFYSFALVIELWQGSICTLLEADII